MRTEVRQRTGSVVGVHKPACAWHIDTDVYIQVCKDLASSYGCQIHRTSAVSQCSPSHCCSDDLHTSQLHRYTRLLCSSNGSHAFIQTQDTTCCITTPCCHVCCRHAQLRAWCCMPQVPGLLSVLPSLHVYMPANSKRLALQKHVQRTLSMAMQHLGSNSSCYARHASPLRSACWRHSLVGNKVTCW